MSSPQQQLLVEAYKPEFPIWTSPGWCSTFAATRRGLLPLRGLLAEALAAHQGLGARPTRWPKQDVFDLQLQALVRRNAPYSPPGCLPGLFLILDGTLPISSVLLPAGGCARPSSGVPSLAIRQSPSEWRGETGRSSRASPSARLVEHEEFRWVNTVRGNFEAGPAQQLSRRSRETRAVLGRIPIALQPPPRVEALAATAVAGRRGHSAHALPALICG